MELSPVDIKPSQSEMGTIHEEHSLNELHPTSEEPELEMPTDDNPLSTASSPSKSFTFDAFQPVSIDGGYAQTPMPTLSFNHPPAVPRKIGGVINDDHGAIPMSIFHHHQLQRTTSLSEDNDIVGNNNGCGGHDGPSSPPLPSYYDAPPYTCFITTKAPPHSCPPARPQKTNRGTFIRAKVKRSLNMINRRGGGAPLPPTQQQQQQTRISGAFKPYYNNEEGNATRHKPPLPAAAAGPLSSAAATTTTVAGVARKRFEADLVSPPSLPRKTSRTIEEDGFAADIMSRLSLGGDGGKDK